MKKILVVVFLLLLSFGLCGCMESDEEKLARLDREAREARQRANDAQERVTLLESIFGN